MEYVSLSRDTTGGGGGQMGWGGGGVEWIVEVEELVEGVVEELGNFSPRVRSEAAAGDPGRLRLLRGPERRQGRHPGQVTEPG